MLDNFFENFASKDHVPCEKEVSAVVDENSPSFRGVGIGSPEKTTIIKNLSALSENLTEPTRDHHGPPVTIIGENYSEDGELAADMNVQNKTEQSEIPTSVSSQPRRHSVKTEDMEVTKNVYNETRNGIMIEMTTETDVNTPGEDLSNQRNVDTVISGDEDKDGAGNQSFDERCLKEIIMPESGERKSQSESNIQEILSSEHISNTDTAVLSSDTIPATTNNKHDADCNDKADINDKVDQLNQNFTTQIPEVTTKPQKSEKSETDNVHDKVTQILYAVLNDSQKQKTGHEQVSTLNRSKSCEGDIIEKSDAHYSTHEVCEEKNKEKPRKDRKMREDLNVSQPSTVDRIDENETFSTHKVEKEKNPYEIANDSGIRPRLSGNDENCEVASETVEIRVDRHGPAVSGTQLEATVEDDRNMDEQNRKNQMVHKSNEIAANWASVPVKEEPLSDLEDDDTNRHWLPNSFVPQEKVDRYGSEESRSVYKPVTRSSSKSLLQQENMTIPNVEVSQVEKEKQPNSVVMVKKELVPETEEEYTERELRRQKYCNKRETIMCKRNSAQDYQNANNENRTNGRREVSTRSGELMIGEVSSKDIN